MSSVTTARNIYVSSVITVMKILLIRGYNIGMTNFQLLRTDLTEVEKSKLIWESENPSEFANVERRYSQDVNGKMKKLISEMKNPVSRFKYSKYIDRIERTDPLTPIISVFLAENGTSPGTDLVSSMASKSEDERGHILFITVDPLTSKARDKLIDYNNDRDFKLWHFTYKELVSPVIFSALASRHILQTDQEKCDELTSYYISDPLKMPRIYNDDMLYRVYGADEGNVFFSKRDNYDNSAMVDSVFQIRVCINKEIPKQ